MQRIVDADLCEVYEPSPLGAERPSGGTGRGSSLRRQFLPSGQCLPCTRPSGLLWTSAFLGLTSGLLSLSLDG